MVIRNNWSSSILFELAIDQQELNQTYPGSIIVPGKEILHFLQKNEIFLQFFKAFIVMD